MICYHHDDLDGKAAAYCVHAYKPKTIPDTPESYIQCTYEDKFDKHTEKDDVFIVDLSISPATWSAFLNVCKTARTVTWIDHHKSSIDIVSAHKDELQNIKNLTYFISDCACGAALTYAFFKISAAQLNEIRHIEEGEEYNISAKYINRDIDVTIFRINKKDPTDSRWFNYKIRLPKWLFHIDDYDCWKNLNNITDYFILGCDSNNTAFTVYNKMRECRTFNNFWYSMEHNYNVDTLIESGKRIYDYIHSRYRRELKYTFEWTNNGTTFVCKSGTGNSWAFENLITKYPAVILFYYDGSCGKWKYSVYSDEKSTFDCKKFCEKFGGGGHLHAAGFSTDKLIFTSPEYNTIESESIIFLGGTCNNDAWRESFIQNWKNLSKQPGYEQAKDIELFNPIVDDWNEEAQKKEEEIKNKAFINLFVITPRMNGVFSIAEAVECSHRSNTKTVFAIYDKYNDKFSDDGSVEKSLDATGKLIENNGGVFIKVNGENASNDLVEAVMKLVIK